MNTIKAIGIDLVNTLITIDPAGIDDAFGKLVRSLEESGFGIDPDPFRQTYRREAARFFKEAHESGRETYNRFWIRSALSQHGYDVSADDKLLDKAVESYFSAFYSYCRPIPGVIEALALLKERYRLGLLSNFTYAPVVRETLDHLRLTRFFETILVSADLGYRKPHPLVFETLAQRLELAAGQMIFIGDELEPDIFGAKSAGLTPIWFTYVKDTRTASVQGLANNDDREIGPDTVRMSSWSDILKYLGAD